MSNSASNESPTLNINHPVNPRAEEQRKPQLTGITFVESGASFSVSKHLIFSYVQQPSYEVVQAIAKNFATRLNQMGTGNKYEVVDVSSTSNVMTDVRFQIKSIHPQLSHLNSVHYTVSRNSNLSTEHSVGIYVEGYSSEKDDLIAALRAYHALLVTGI